MNSAQVDRYKNPLLVSIICQILYKPNEKLNLYNGIFIRIY